jgi:hypothetical protein
MTRMSSYGKLTYLTAFRSVSVLYDFYQESVNNHSSNIVVKDILIAAYFTTIPKNKSKKHIMNKFIFHIIICTKAVKCLLNNIFIMAIS